MVQDSVVRLEKIILEPWKLTNLEMGVNWQPVEKVVIIVNHEKVISELAIDGNDLEGRYYLCEEILILQQHFWIELIKVDRKIQNERPSKIF